MIAGRLTFIGESRRAIKYYDNMPTRYVQMSKEVNFTEQRWHVVPPVPSHLIPILFTKEDA